MAYYENRVEHLDGDLILYQRNLATAVPNVKSHRKPTWYMKLKVGHSKRVINRSTKLTSYEEAYAFARKEYNRLTNAVEMGHTLNDFTFEAHWQEWFDRNVAQGSWKAARQRWHQNQAARYYKTYFRTSDGGSMRLNEITSQVAASYWDWRIAYWSSQEGQKLQTYNPKRRGAKTTTTNNAAKVPSAKTLQMDQTALNQIFRDARERGRMQQQFHMKPPKRGGGNNRRPHFEKDEYQSLVQYLLSYRNCNGHFKDDRVNGWHRLQRQQLYHFVIFMLNTGLRVGEARQMRWRDIKFDVGDDNAGESVCVVGVRKQTKTEQNRDVQSQPNANKTLKEWKEKSPFTGTNDLVWFGKNDDDGKQTAFTDLNKTFQAFLQRVPIQDEDTGLLFNKEGEKRSLYSLRHTYATVRRAHGVRYEDLSLNMGCSVLQLQKHYDHSTSNSRRSSIVQFKRKTKTVTGAASLDAFTAQALAMFKAGTMDEQTFMGIMRSVKDSK
jgi:integrase